MRLTRSRLGILISLGLHESESRVYLTLLDHSSLTAATLAKMADVPRSHLYKVLQDLQSRGLVEILLQGNARSYRAKPLRSFLEAKAMELRARLQELEKDIATTADAFEPPPLDQGGEPESGDVRIVVGRRAVAREIDEMLTTAKERVVLAGSDNGHERLIRHALPFLERSEGTRVRYEFILPPAAVHSPWMSRLRESPQVVIRWFRIGRSVMSVMQDDTRTLFIEPLPDTAEMRVGRDFGIFSGDRAFTTNQYDLLVSASEADEPAPAAARASEPNLP